MDYISETMQRQARIWRGLFGAEEREEESQEQTRQRSETALSEWARQREENTAQSEKMRRGRETELLRQRTGASWEDASQQREAAKMVYDDAQTEASGYEEEWQVQERSRGNGGETTQRSDARRNRRQAESGERERAGVSTMRQVGMMGAMDAEMEQARELSRSFERDARRYDGGFIFY